MAYYVGILDGSRDVWGVRIPDVRGCYGGGATPEAALADATSALREFAAHQAAKGIALKPPRSVQDVIRDEAAEFDAPAGEAIVMVPLILDQARPVKANISLDAGLLEAIDDEAGRRGLTRSSFLTSAALAKIVGAEDPVANAVVAKLRAELEATHERLARQAAHFMGEMRRMGGEDDRKKSRVASITGSALSEKSKHRAAKGARKERSRGRSTA